MDNARNPISPTIVNWPPNSKIRRIPIDIVYNGKLVSFPKFLTMTEGMTVDNVMNLLPALDGQPNMELTPGCIHYWRGIRLVVSGYWGRNGLWRLEGMPITEEYLTAGLPSFNVTHPHDLRHGKYSTTNPLAGIPDLDPWKCGKRIKLFTGWKVRGSHPDPGTIGETPEAPDGVIYVSPEYARRFKLHPVYSGTPGNVVEVNGLHMVEPQVVPLQNGDKIAGTLPNGWAVKGSATIEEGLPYDVLVPTDAIKLRDVPYRATTRFWIKSRAAERLTTSHATLSYQAGQFMPWVVHRKIQELLVKPILLLESEEYGLSPLDLVRSIRTELWSEAIRLTTMDLFQWIVKDEEGTPEVIDGKWATAIKDGLVPHPEEGDTQEVLLRKVALRKAMGRELRRLMDKLLNPPVSAIWGVLMPHDGPMGTISLPTRGWNALGRPRVVAALRMPIKGLTSIVRLEVTTHEDGSDIRVSPGIVRHCWNGDHDGDLVQVIADREVVAHSTPPKEGIARNITATEEVTLPNIGHGQTLPIDLAQVVVARNRSTIATATTVRDNMMELGGTEDEALRLFEALLQPALAEMDGGDPVATYLMAHPQELSDITGIPVEKLVTGGAINKWPRPQLAELRCSWNRVYRANMDTLAARAREAADAVVGGSDNPHDVILTAFAPLADEEEE